MNAVFLRDILNKIPLELPILMYNAFFFFSKGDESHDDEHGHEHGKSRSNLGGAGGGTGAVGAPLEKGERWRRRC